MTRDLEICSIVALLLFSSCTSISIPDAVLEQDRQREPLLSQCATAISTFNKATDPGRVNLDMCEQHQDLAEKIMDYFRSFPEEREVTWDEAKVFTGVANDYVSLGIELCYAKVRLGEKINDPQGRSGTAACDRLVDEIRHQRTLRAIKKASEEIRRDIFIYRQRDY